MTSTNPSFSLPFLNEPFCDFKEPETAAAIQKALVTVTALLGQHYPLGLQRRKGSTEEQIVSVNPAMPSQVIGSHEAASAEDADTAVAMALEAWPQWSACSMQERAEVLLRTSGKLRDRKMEFSAWLVLETGKNWEEADADTAEAIDFLEYYARQAMQLATAEPFIQFPGERNELVYLPLGVGAVIPPWNFPLAIMAGMTCAAIVTGNTVVLKPSPLAPTIAVRFRDLLIECGMPENVVTLMQGGPEFGDALVQHPDIRFIAFTGSKKVGLHIHARAAQTQPGQRAIKRTILELGGKDAIIVEADADLESAAAGVVASAFGFNGQKCSACSRVIVNEAVHDTFVNLLKQNVAKLTQGAPAANYSVGPVINDAAYARVLDYIRDADGRATVVVGGKAQTAPEQGYYIMPTILTGLTSQDRLCQEEIFGPVLAVLRSTDFDDALRIANDTEYGLTGSVYTSSKDKQNKAASEFQVGNLYFNRKCTGAMVGAHPFGGFKMSGTDSKAGGPDYLLLFTQAKSIAHKLA